MKSSLETNHIEMCSKNNEGKCCWWQIFKNIKNIIYKYMTSISKNVYIDKLDDKSDKYNNTCQRAVKMKHIDARLRTYIESSKEIYYQDPKIGNIVRISKYKKVFGKDYIQNGSEDILWLKKLKALLCRHILSVILKDKMEEIFWMFYKKIFQKSNRKEFRIEQVIKRKDDKLYVKWKGYDSF